MESALIGIAFNLTIQSTRLIMYLRVFNCGSLRDNYKSGRYRFALNKKKKKEEMPDGKRKRAFFSRND